MSDAIRVGVIGTGRIGRLHAELLERRVPGLALAAVYDPDERAAREVGAAFGAPALASAAELIGSPGVDAVAICSSAGAHVDLVVAVAEAGKPAFCEKPLSLSLTEVDRALAAVEEAGVLLQIGFNRRFDANYRRVRQAIEQGEIGDIELLHIISRDPAPPPIAYVRVSGGIFLDMTIHDFDMARFLAGSEVEEVYASGAVRVDPAIGAAGDLDTVLVVLKFANGAIGTIDNSRRAAYGYDQRVEVLGSTGAISTGNNYANTAVLSDAQSVRRDLPLHFFLERYTESFAAELKVFVDAVLRDLPVPVTGADARAPVVMGLAARKSYDEHRPVRLSEIAG